VLELRATVPHVTLRHFGLWYIRGTVDTEAPPARGRGRSPALAALLSFLWPGLGQLYAGRRRLAAVFAAPAVLVTLVLLYQMRQGLVVFGTRFLSPRFALAALFIVLAIGAWRLVSVVHASLTGRPFRTQRTLERASLIALAAIVLLTHSAAGYVLWVSYQADTQVFDPVSPLVDVTTTPVPILSPGITPGLTPTAAPTPSINSRVTILFTGGDYDPTRGADQSARDDSIMVVSYDPKANSVQMISVPRDANYYPLYFGGRVGADPRINALSGYVRNGWVRSPDPPYTTLVKEVSFLIGIPIDYYAAMNLNGFVKMIDMVGGIDVVNPSVIDDPLYATPVGEVIGFHLAAGPQHLDGLTALAYVRSKFTAGENDFSRSTRQQEVLVDLLHKMAQPSEILQLPSLISTMGSSVTTNFPADQVADYVAIGQNIPSANFKQVVLSPTAGYSMYVGSAVCLNAPKLAQLSIQLFGTDSTWYGQKQPVYTCP
jgi:LCP family protein required for cell wall assembly